MLNAARVWKRDTVLDACVFREEPKDRFVVFMVHRQRCSNLTRALLVCAAAAIFYRLWGLGQWGKKCYGYYGYGAVWVRGLPFLITRSVPVPVVAPYP